MKLVEKMSVRSVRYAMGVLAGSVLLSSPAMAQEEIQKVEVTGSSIKRIAVEGALPIQRYNAEQIAKMGATNVAEALQALPAMQGFTIAATAAGTNSGGNVGASIHDIGTSYTLVLLNGRRLAPQGSGGTVNLNAIPMSAIERIEVLTDGASALYGSDAIAGVINFILKKNQQGGEVEATYTQPQQSADGRTATVGLSYGFGDLQVNRFNVMMSYRHDEQKQLKATDRDFASTAYIPFSNNGTNYIFDKTSTAAAPGNVAVKFKDGTTVGFNPYLARNGACPTLNQVSLANTATTKYCGFDYAATVEVVPESKRDSLFTKGTFKLTNDISLFTDIVYTRYDITARIAPNTAPFTIATGTQSYNDNVLPFLTADQAANVASVSGNYRTYDWGTRDSQTITETKHIVFGTEMDLGPWNVNGAVTWSENSIDERYVGGYVKDAEFRSMLATRAFDPFAPIGQQSEATKALIKESLFHGSIRTASTTLKGVDGHASREIFSLPGGMASIGVGADYRQYHYEQSPSDAAAEGAIYNFNAPAAYDMKRDTYGAFAELITPVTKQLEFTTALRYDNISAIKNGLENREMGKDQSANTYKVSARFQPTQKVLLRASYGTGFKAPSMLDIGQPLVNAGFTASKYVCPTPGGVYCRDGGAAAQYNVYSGGNEDLKPEKSKQYSIGFRYEPVPSFTFGADLWDVKIRDAVSGVSEQQAFGDPAKFASLFTTYTEPSTGDTYYAFKELSINIGKTHNQGIDYDFTGRHNFGFGKFTANLSGTYLIKSEYTVPGTDNDWTDSMNKFGINNAVSFRNLAKITTTLETGALTNSLIVSYRNGYTDAEASVRNLTTNKNENIRLHVPSYITFDWQGRYMFTKALSARFGVRNLFDRDPPFSLRQSSGHQVGYDPRYADALGRSFYLTGNYKF